MPERSGADGEPARIALVLIDGVGDVSVPSLGMRTPLQVQEYFVPLLFSAPAGALAASLCAQRARESSGEIYQSS